MPDSSAGPPTPDPDDAAGASDQPTLGRRMKSRATRPMKLRSLATSPLGGADRFDRFTERAKQSLVLAQKEAELLNHNYIGTEHLLLALIAEREGIAAKVLTGLGVELDKARSCVELVVGRGSRPFSGNLRLTPRSKKVILELAIDEARRLNHSCVGTEHLLLGLIREGEGIAAGVLESLGIDMGQARAQTLQMLTAGSSQHTDTEKPSSGALPGVNAPRDSVITCRVDSGDLEAIDALIEAGICSTRSDAAAWLIHAGIQANLDLFDKLYSTIAEIKRLREQARSTVQNLTGEPRDRHDPDTTPRS